MQRLHTTCSLNIYISVIPKQTAWEQLKVHYVELTFYIQYFMGCSINSCWKMTLNLFELICFDHKQAYVLFFCISVAISWYVKQQSQYLENTIFFSYTCCSPQIQVHAPGWTEMLTYLPQQLCVLKTELVLDKFFTDVTFDPCQATMCLGHVVGQARWYLSASRPHAGSAEFTRGGGEKERATATNLFQDWLTKSQAVLFFILQMGHAENEMRSLMYGKQTRRSVVGGPNRPGHDQRTGPP